MKNFKKTPFWRLFVVLYFLAYLPLPFILLLALFDFGRTYHTSKFTYGYYTWNISEAIIPMVIILCVYAAVIEGIRWAALYVIGVKSLGIVGTIVKLNQEAEAEQKRAAELEKVLNPPKPYDFKRLYWIVGLTIGGFAIFILGSVLVGLVAGFLSR